MNLPNKILLSLALTGMVWYVAIAEGASPRKVRYELKRILVHVLRDDLASLVEMR